LVNYYKDEVKLELNLIRYDELLTMIDEL